MTAHQEAEAKSRAQRMSDSTLAERLRFYADDLESEGRLHAPACIREAADRLEKKGAP